MYDNLWDESPRVKKMKKQYREEGRKESEQERLRLQQELVKRDQELAKREQEAEQERLRMQQELAKREQEAEQKILKLQEKMQAMLEKAAADQEVKARRSSLVSVIRVRFPNLTEVAQQSVELFDKPEILDLLTQQIVVAPDANAARLLLNPSTQAHE
jgi:hypothetical protein